VRSDAKTAAIEGIRLSYIRDELRQSPGAKHSGQFRLHRIADRVSPLHRKSVQHQLLDMQCDRSI